MTLTFSSIQSNAWDHYYEVFFGTEGTLLLSGEREALLFYEGGKKEATNLKIENVRGDAPVMQASESRARDAAGTAVSSTAAGFNALTAYRLELEGFAQTIRDGRPNLCPPEEGMRAAVATIMGYDAIAQKAAINIRQDVFPEVVS